MNNILGPLATIVSLSGYAIAIYTTVRGGFRPQRMTRFLIFLVSLLFVGTLLAQGDTNGIYVAGAQLIGSAVLFVISIKKGMGGYGKLDITVLILALISLVVWQTTDNALLGLIMSIVTDIIGFTPTLIKMWQHPETEEWKFYLADIISSSLALASITVFALDNTVFPLYILLINTISVVMIILRNRWKKRQKSDILHILR